MTSNLLDPSAILSLLPGLLPSDKKLGSPQDGIMALLHAAMSALAFRLIGADDSASVNSFQDNVLPDEWNKDGPGHYVLRYRHDQSSLDFVVKLTKLGGRSLINAIAVEVRKVSIFA
jgi:proteasome inhibitor subunit 1 (PI31)